jgi:hypothetical protein
MSKHHVIKRIAAICPSLRPDRLRGFSLQDLTGLLRELESDAVQTLKKGGSLPDLAQAVGQLMERSIANPTVALDLIEALKYDGFVAEQASLALYNRLGLSVPKNRSKLEMRANAWRKKIKAWLSRIETRIDVRLAVSA